MQHAALATELAEGRSFWCYWIGVYSLPLMIVISTAQSSLLFPSK